MTCRKIYEFNYDLCVRRWYSWSTTEITKLYKNIRSWYKINRLKIIIDENEVMLIRSTAPLNSLNVDDFILSYEDTHLELFENAKYIGMFINWNIPWDFHVWRFSQTSYIHVSSLIRLRRIFLMNLLLQVYKCYLQPRSYYGNICMAATPRKGLTWFQEYKFMQQGWMRNLDNLNPRGIDLVKCLNLYTIRERRYYLILTLMCNAIHGIARNNLSDRIATMHNEIYKNSFFVSGWQTLEWSAKFCKELYEYRNY